MKNTFLFFLIITHLTLIGQIDNGLVLNLPFNGNANDEAGSSLIGTVVNAIPTQDRFGNANSAYYFNGINAYILFPHREVFNFGPSDFVISIWIKQEVNQNKIEATDDNDVLSKWLFENGNLPDEGTGGYPFVVRIKNQTSASHGNTRMARWNGESSMGGCEDFPSISTANGGMPDSTFNDNMWHHFVFRKITIGSNSFLNVFVDGVDYGLQPDSTQDTDMFGCTTANNAPLIIGARYNGLRHFTGSIDDIKIWNRGLTESEIKIITSTRNITKPKMKIHPNPANGRIWIENINRKPIQSIQVYGISGNLIKSIDNGLFGPAIEIQLPNHKGLLLVRIQVEDGLIYTERVMCN